MGRYRQKQIIVDANRWFQNGDHPFDEHVKGTVNEGKLVRRYRTPALDGKDICKDCGYMMHDHGWIDAPDLTVCPGDWIIRGDKGEFYPKKNDAFEETYEEVEANG